MNRTETTEPHAEHDSLVDNAVVHEKSPKNHNVENDVHQDLQYQDGIAKEHCKNSNTKRKCRCKYTSG